MHLFHLIVFLSILSILSILFLLSFLSILSISSTVSILSVLSILFVFCDLCVYLSIFLSIFLSIYLSIDLSIYLSLYVSFCLSIYLSIHPSIYLSIYLSLSLIDRSSSIFLSFWCMYLSDLALCPFLFLTVYPIYRSIYLSVCLSIWSVWCVYLIYLLAFLIYLFDLTLYLPLYLADLSDPPSCLTDEHLANLQGACKNRSWINKHAAIARDFLQKWKLQSWKRSNFARLPPFWRCWLHNLRLRTTALGDVSIWSVESTALATKNWSRVIGSAVPATRNDLQNFKKSEVQQCNLSHCKA